MSHCIVRYSCLYSSSTKKINCYVDFILLVLLYPFKIEFQIIILYSLLFFYNFFSFNNSKQLYEIQQTLKKKYMCKEVEDLKIITCILLHDLNIDYHVLYMYLIVCMT